MHIPSFLKRAYVIASPAHHKAARQRKKEYKAHFEEHKEENLKRVRRLSQLRGDEDPADFLFDSTYGTGAARTRSYQSASTPAYSRTQSHHTPGRPFSMIHDSSYTSHHPMPPNATSLAQDRGERRTSNNSTLRTSSTASATTRPSVNSSRSASNELQMSGALAAGETPIYEAAVAMSVTRPRARPISMPTNMPHRSGIQRKNSDWWLPAETRPQQEEEFVQVVGRQSGERELRMSAIVA